ncbi:DUF5681 domain-containing protein [Nitrosomonas oligotropha]|uniref:DUF5681 domain-containing protein n=1 Tax=Nitrosomonas oligotropha TaxID=42354 RepID=UPI001369DEFE|nr:DUF5681 domain-containing protein [Nitrosomonas oligotropha]MXS81522.1 hypothetical protein [Nitrosomonas oligotropha]
MTAENKKRGRWKAGESGNPNGRKPGTGKVAQLRESIAQHLPAIIQQLVTKAKEGDSQAARILLERVIPPIKSIDSPVEIKLPEDADLSTQGQIIIQAVANGVLVPSQGSDLLTSLSTLARIKEFDELEKRLIALEEANESKK